MGCGASASAGEPRFARLVPGNSMDFKAPCVLEVKTEDDLYLEAFKAEMAKGIRMHGEGDSQDLLSFASLSFIPDDVALASGHPLQSNAHCDRVHLERLAKLMQVADGQRRSDRSRETFFLVVETRRFQVFFPTFTVIVEQCTPHVSLTSSRNGCSSTTAVKHVCLIHPRCVFSLFSRLRLKVLPIHYMISAI
ncbi:unnamed protein product [Polarella glacialis]|uniref:Uncharacterized protein n=1 Tax=Polarella glacialis TaxID=89957 RepID=A0A813EC59_POLGL|nr:unnamed protein product [Polarella glacialis]